MVRYYDDGYFTWKIEGKVLTMQRMKPELLNACKDAKTTPPQALEDWHKNYLEKALERAKNAGIEIIEVWVNPRDLAFLIEDHTKHGRKFEVVRTERDGQVLCRLLL